MSDLISRAAAIDAFYIQSDDDGWWVGTAQDAETLLNGLPTAEKVGKWIEVENKWGGLDIRCSECGYGEMVLAIYESGHAYDAIRHLTTLLEENNDH